MLHAPGVFLTWSEELYGRGGTDRGRVRAGG